VKFLLDTHTFLWWITDDPQLSEAAREIIRNSDNELFLSVASAWEMAIRVRLGRLHLPDRPDRFVPDQLARNGIQPLPIEMSHALYVARLPSIHNDPFDRLIVAQSMLEKLPIITKDGVIAKYEVTVVW
jgi:PIN domain nuclease of toxin-antitoxin system